MSQTMYQKLSEVFVNRFQIDQQSIRPDSTLDELGFDSLGLVELAVNAQDTLGVYIDEDSLDPNTTVTGTVHLLEAALAAA